MASSLTAARLSSAEPTDDNIESKLKYLIKDRCLRISEYFKDYDPLRSGYITKNQFRRCMDQNLGLQLSDDEYVLLTNKYTNNKGLFNYLLFIDAMQIPFNPNQLDGRPFEQVDSKKTRVTATLSMDDKRKTDELLEICANYYQLQGITVKPSYQDFDRHSMGYITLSQFHRNFPGPTELSQNDISLIANRYYDPLTKLYNYFQFNKDINSIWNRNSNTSVKSNIPPATFVRQDSPHLEDIFQKIRDAVYINGIRTTEFFVDHDKFHCGIITENQFICGLSLCISQKAHLTREEINSAIKYFSTSDGRVKYKEFCDIMENAYNEPNLEKKPTLSVYRPMKGHLQKQVNVLSPNDEIELETALIDLKDQVKKRQLLLYPYFRDFDRKKGFTRGVTKAQFERILHFLSLSVSPNSMKLITQKFEYPLNGDVNYTAFVQAIDDEYIGQTVETESDDVIKTSFDDNIGTHKEQHHVDIEKLIQMFQDYVSVNRIRTCEFFQDFDLLRSGFITSTRFRQGLSAMGFPHLTDSEIQALCDRYTFTKPNMSQAIAWKAFVYDIDKVFGRNIVTTKSVNVDVSEHDKQIIQTVLNRLKDEVNQRRIHLKPCFQDFDKHNCGYVTNYQFCQCLSFLELKITSEELSVLQIQYSNNKGFNYLEFIEELDPKEKYENKYEQHISTVITDREKLDIKLNTFDTSIDTDKLIDRIKIKVVKERIRLLEFMKDYDKLRSGCISMVSFHRALDLCGFGLNISEVKALSERYRSVKDENCVDYISFNDEVESVFTVNELEKMPTIQINQYIPPEDVDMNQLSREDEQIFETCMLKLANIVHIRCIQLISLFEDYDKIHRGCVSKGQFRRVLSQLDLSKYLSDTEIDIICNKFGVNVGGRMDVQYNAFCLLVDEHAHNK